MKDDKFRIYGQATTGTKKVRKGKTKAISALIETNKP